MRSAANKGLQAPRHGSTAGMLVHSLAREDRCGGAVGAGGGIGKEHMGSLAAGRAPLTELPADDAGGAAHHVARVLRSKHDSALWVLWAAHTRGSLPTTELLATAEDRDVHALAAVVKQACLDPGGHARWVASLSFSPTSELAVQKMQEPLPPLDRRADTPLPPARTRSPSPPRRSRTSSSSLRSWRSRRATRRPRRGASRGVRTRRWHSCAPRRMICIWGWWRRSGW
jgi:hypothetical protein